MHSRGPSGGACTRAALTHAAPRSVVCLLVPARSTALTRCDAIARASLQSIALAGVNGKVVIAGSFMLYIFIVLYVGAIPSWGPNDLDIFCDDVTAADKIMRVLELMHSDCIVAITPKSTNYAPAVSA